MKTLVSFVILVCMVTLLEKSVPAAERAAGGPLSDYVSKKDGSYQWTKHHDGRLGGTSYTELILTSQTWHGIVWKHQLFVIKPSSVAADTKHALLIIAGGNWKEELADPDHKVKLPGEATLFATIAEQLKTPVAVLLHVPQQPIFDGKVEDQIIAHTFREFMRTQDPELPLLLPMVKSAVRAMDAVAEYAGKAWSMDLETFTVTGGSKRGWTTWLTGAVDKRATAIAPMVIDVLNIGRHLDHQLAVWGDYSHKIHDYTDIGLHKRLRSRRGRALQKIVDPYSYRQQLTQPKLIMIGTNDPYWPLDSLNLYWNGLVGQKYILYVPNNGHGLHDLPRLVGTLGALHRQAAGGQPMPKLAWKHQRNGTKHTLRVTSDVAPHQVNAWIATSPTRDFRQAQWSSQPAQADGDAYVYDLDIPTDGYAALFGEAVYKSESLPYYLSTNVRIISADGAE